jgi:gluconate kinase
MTTSSNTVLLDLTHAPAVLFFFGLSGAGKTHVGQLVSRLSGRFLYDADADITDAMRHALATQQPFTEAMRAEYFPRIVQKIYTLQQQYGALVVTQAVYKQQHREALLAQIHDMHLLCVCCNESVLQKRLAARVQGISAASAAALMADFEMPSPSLPCIHNSDDTEVVRQLNSLYGVK